MQSFGFTDCPAARSAHASLLYPNFIYSSRTRCAPACGAHARCTRCSPAISARAGRVTSARSSSRRATCRSRSRLGRNKNAYTMLKRYSRARFTEASGSKIRGFIADLELFMRMSARTVHHWEYFLLAFLGTDEAENVRRWHLAEAVADYCVFKQGVETLFGKYEFVGSYRAM